jgi:CDP-2,3-bis-(O-geranylgeranyl)-sn-glycerol synthase
MHYLPILQLLILLTLANGGPVMAKLVFASHLARPLDGNLVLADGRPLLGSSKTIRGVMVAVLVTTACAPLLGLEFKIGAMVGMTAMAGDLFSSFLKRRLGLVPSSRATGLDQIPESLLPVLACSQALSLTAVDVAVTVAAFFVGELLLSRLLFLLHVRDRPY